MTEIFFLNNQFEEKVLRYSLLALFIPDYMLLVL